MCRGKEWGQGVREGRGPNSAARRDRKMPGNPYRSVPVSEVCLTPQQH